VPETRSIVGGLYAPPDSEDARRREIRALLQLNGVNGATVNLSFTAQTQAVELRVDPSGWFNDPNVNFSALVGVTPIQGHYWDTSNCAQGGNDFDGARCTFQNSLYKGAAQVEGVYQFTVTP
jgi:hypothetical protein